MGHNYFFAFSGNIGVGKTTWTRLLNQRFNWRPYYEKVVENPYLADFYQDMKRWSYHSQIFFLTQRFKEHLEIQKSSTMCIQDRTIFEDGEIFAYNLHLRENMSERDYKSYRDLFDSMLSSLRYPDLIIYLRASIRTLVSRIHRRGRDYERGIDREYLAQLNNRYNDWIEDYATHHRVLVIDTDDFDIERDEKRLDEILKKIGAYEVQLELFPNINHI